MILELHHKTWMPIRERAGNIKTSHDCCVGKLVMTLTSGEINHPDIWYICFISKDAYSYAEDDITEEELEAEKQIKNSIKTKRIDGLFRRNFKGWLHLKASLLKWKLRNDLKAVTDCASLMSLCRLFQSPGALTPKTQWPLELSLYFRTARKATTIEQGVNGEKLVYYCCEGVYQNQ